MAVRNCAEIGENLIKIMTRLQANQNLLKYLYYTDKDPLSNSNLTEQQIKEEIFEKLIKVTPRVGPKDTAKSIVSIRVVRADKDSTNNEFRNVLIQIEIFVPLTQWIIKGTQLRPFGILGEIQKSLDNKEINGLGKMKGGDFTLNFLTDEIGCYEQSFYITSYD